MTRRKTEDRSRKMNRLERAYWHHPVTFTFDLFKRRDDRLP